MYKLYVMRGALVWDIDKFIEENLKDSLKKFNISHEIMKLVIESEPFLIVSNYGSFTKAEMEELRFLMMKVGGWEDKVGTIEDSIISN